jgi:hypothetical protein
MVKIPISKQVSVKWLTRELQVAGVDVVSVGEDYAEVAEADEDLALTVIEAHDLAAIEAKEAVIMAAPDSVKAWFNSNPSAKLIFSMTVSEVAAEIASLVDTSFSGQPAALRTKWKLLLTAVVLVVRIFVKRERLD